MLPATGQSRESFAQQVLGAVDTFYTQYAEQADYVSYFKKQWGNMTGQFMSAHLVMQIGCSTVVAFNHILCL